MNPLLSYNTTLPRGARAFGRELHADFNVSVYVFADRIEMRATENVVYSDEDDNATPERACYRGEPFTPADEEERDRLNAEMAQAYADLGQEMPEDGGFSLGPRLQSSIRPYHFAQPEEPEDYDQRPQLGRAA